MYQRAGPVPHARPSPPAVHQPAVSFPTVH